jgi:hypothetical protein
VADFGGKTAYPILACEGSSDPGSLQTKSKAFPKKNRVGADAFVRPASHSERVRPSIQRHHLAIAVMRCIPDECVRGYTIYSEFANSRIRHSAI